MKYILVDLLEPTDNWEEDFEGARDFLTNLWFDDWRRGDISDKEWEEMNNITDIEELDARLRGCGHALFKLEDREEVNEMESCVDIVREGYFDN